MSPASWSRRFFNRQHWPKYLFGTACLATLAVLVVTLDSRRRAEAQPSPDQSTPYSSPELTTAEKLVPPPVPEAENFAAVPYFATLFNKATRSDSDRRWPDDFLHADRWPRRFPNMADSAVGRRTGRYLSDMASWKTAFERSQGSAPPEGSEEIAINEQPDPTANAQAAVAVLAALKPYEPVLAELREASHRRGQSRYDIRYDWQNPWGILLPHLAVFKRTTQVLRLKACAELATGHSGQGLRDALLALRLVDSVRSEPFLISHLVRVACLEITMQPIWEGLAMHRWSESELVVLQGALEQCDFLVDLRRCLEAERNWGNLTIALFRDKRSPATFSSLMSEDGKADAWVQEADKALRRAPRDWFEAEQQNFNRLFDAHLLTGFDVDARRVHPSAADDNATQLQQAVRGRTSAVKEHLVFAKSFLVALGKVHVKMAGAQSSTDLAVVACALERFRLATGEFPKALDELTPRFLARVPHDLITGQPLRYQKSTDNQFVLYSIGWNETDDGGEPGFLASGGGTDRKQGDWVWRYPAVKPSDDAKP